MGTRIPLHFGNDEIARLHDVAHTAALQAGAKGGALDILTAEIFASMAKHANVATLAADRRASLKLVG